MLPKPRINETSKLYYMQKFTKEIVKVWQGMPTLPDGHPQLKW